MAKEIKDFDFILSDDTTEVKIFIGGKWVTYLRSDIANKKVFDQIQNKFYGSIDNQQQQVSGSGGCSGCP